MGKIAYTKKDKLMKQGNSHYLLIPKSILIEFMHWNPDENKVNQKFVIAENRLEIVLEEAIVKKG